jgi:hypothetical protein
MRALAVSQSQMMRQALPALLCLAAATTACGDFSQEDLLFLAAVPPKESVELRPAGVESGAGEDSDGQALTAGCGENDLRCEAVNIATGFNKVTFDLLNLVDTVVANPPSYREKNRRVWGPHFDPKTLATYRFEMVRSEDGGTFGFCLHAKRGTVRWGSADDVTCESDEHEESGLKVFLSGQFTPGKVEDARAKSGMGSMTVQTGRFDGGRFAERLEIDFDNTAGTQIDVALIGVGGGTSEVERDAAYSFVRRADNSGSFFFELFGNIVEPLQSEVLERVTIEAAWLDDQSGRADASITEGDVPDDIDAVVHQCWNAGGETTWVAPFGQAATGDEASCVIAESLLD